jgi:hypothetical protein
VQFSELIQTFFPPPAGASAKSLAAPLVLQQGRKSANVHASSGVRHKGQAGGAKMVELATAALAAALLNNSVSAVDKVYNWWLAKKKERPASKVLRNDPQKEVLQYVSTRPDQATIRVVMTYAELASKLSQDDFNLIKSFEQRMGLAMTQWEALNARLPLSDPVERARIEANMEMMKNGDICKCLNQIVDFIEKLNIDLEDHYQKVRFICSPNQ